MKKFILKTLLIIGIWAVAYGTAYLVGIMFGRSEVSDWTFYVTVGFSIAYGPKIYDYLIKKFSRYQ